jgi:hypothetical protein
MGEVAPFAQKKELAVSSQEQGTMSLLITFYLVIELVAYQNTNYSEAADVSTTGPRFVFV